MKYTLSPLEAWVTKMYRNIRIYDPEELTEENISFAFHIYLRREPVPSNSFEQGRFKFITLDSRLSPAEQREDFFHELAHILRHAGNQTMMPLSFRELQEWDANRFALYASCPIHMFHLFDLRDPDVVNVMSRRFGVTPRLVNIRLYKIKEKLVQNVQS